jgi:NAD(P)-dependent dehydrogenase (short-subunit alcohol dehydrogenase family)
MSVENSVALVTGATGGIGREIARVLGCAGATVVVVGTRQEALDAALVEIEAAGGRGSAFAADITDPSAVEDLFAHILNTWGQLDIVVNTVGVSTPQHVFGDISLAEWDRVFKVNVSAAFLLANTAIPIMRDMGGGTIVNLSSLAALRPALLSSPAYSASKAALNSMSEWINAAEVMHGIRSCVICPGEVDTPMITKRRDHPDREARARMLRPEDVAQTVLFVASMRAGARLDFVPITPYASH